MESIDVKTSFKNMVLTVATRLSVYSFVKRGMVLRKISGSNLALVEFQRSNRSTEDIVIFTINLGIVCGKLSDAPSFQKASVIDAHLSERLGFLLPERDDKWWQITAGTNVIALANALSDAIEEYALPYLEGYMTPEALIALWESGKAPGLTAVQRARLLEELKGAT